MKSREIFREAYVQLKRRPVAILIVAVTYLPWLLVSLLDLPTGNAFVVALVGTLVSNTLVFFGLYIAVAIFFGRGDEEDSPAGLNDALGSIAEHRQGVATLSLAFAAIAFMASEIAQIIIATLGSAGLGNVQGTGLVIGVLILHFLASVLPAFVLTFVALSPQLIHVGGMRKGGEVLEASYRLIKGRYARALPLYLIPLAIATALVTGISFGMIYLPFGWPLVPAFLFVALVMGVTGAFIAASFNRFYLIVEEEEEAKRKAAKKAKGGSKSKPGSSKKKR